MTNWFEQEQKRKYHKVANLFPLLQGEEYQELKRDIAANGLIESIWLHPDKSIIDGRNRHRACFETETQPRFRTWSGDGSLVSFVVSMNLHRRHLSQSQKAVVALGIMPMLEQEAKDRQGERTDLTSAHECAEVEKKPERAAQQAADLIGVGIHYVSDAKKLQREAPDLLEKVREDKLSIPKANKELRKRQLEQERKQLAEKAKEIDINERWSVVQSDIRTHQANKQYDFIITDPPYPREYLELYEVLARRANEWLKPNGLLVAMCGQSYLNQIVEMLDNHLDYYWTGCYYTPGQPKPLRQRQVNTTWKPILMYTRKNEKYSGKIFGDVWISDKNDKEFHKWGQSISGMYALVKQVCLEGQTIFDPFCGAGTTGIAAIKHGCLFDGIDIDIQNVSISRTRISDTKPA